MRMRAIRIFVLAFIVLLTTLLPEENQFATVDLQPNAPFLRLANESRAFAVPMLITDQWYSSKTDGDMWGLAVSRQNTGTAFVAGYSGVWKTVDGGDSWNLASSGLPFPYDFPAIVMARDTDTVLYVAHWNTGFFKTTDGGVSWQRIYTGTVGTMVLSPSNHDVLYVNTATEHYRTSDGGATWQLLNCPGRIVVVDMADPQVAYFTSNGFHKTTDGGNSCSKISSIPFWNVQAEFGSGKRLYGYTQYPHAFYYSDNEGVDWIQTTGTGFPSTDIWGFAIDPANRKHMLVSSTGNGIRETSDGGNTWAPLNTGYTPIGLERNVIIGFNQPPTYYASTHGSGVWQYNSSRPTNVVLSSFSATPGGSSRTNIIWIIVGIGIVFGAAAMRFKRRLS